MAFNTFGTDATDSLTALLYVSQDNTHPNVGALSQGIKDDKNVAHPTIPGSFTRNGFLFVPNRGVLKVLAGDYVALDETTGWPILISAYSAASGPWTIV